MPDPYTRPFWPREQEFQLNTQELHAIIARQQRELHLAHDTIRKYEQQRAQNILNAKPEASSDSEQIPSVSEQKNVDHSPKDLQIPSRRSTSKANDKQQNPVHARLDAMNASEFVLAFQEIITLSSKHGPIRIPNTVNVMDHKCALFFETARADHRFVEELFHQNTSIKTIALPIALILLQRAQQIVSNRLTMSPTNRYRLVCSSLALANYLGKCLNLPENMNTPSLDKELERAGSAWNIHNTDLLNMVEFFIDHVLTLEPKIGEQEIIHMLDYLKEAKTKKKRSIDLYEQGQSYRSRDQKAARKR